MTDTAAGRLPPAGNWPLPARSQAMAAKIKMHNVYLALTFFAVTALGFASLVAIEMIISR